MDMDEYKKANDALKRQIFQGSMAGFKETATNLLLLEDKELRDAYIEQTNKGMLDTLPTEQRAPVQMQIDQSLKLFDNISNETRDNLLKYGVIGER